jgi:16S rRNA G1207 methylase RsmC
MRYSAKKEERETNAPRNPKSWEADLGNMENENLETLTPQWVDFQRSVDDNEAVEKGRDMDTGRDDERLPDDEDRELLIPPQEKLLIDLLEDVLGERVLCTSLGRAQLARAAADVRPSGRVTCWFLDLYRLRLAEAHQEVPIPDSLEFICGADLPTGEYDAALIPISVSGEAELTRDLLQMAYVRLAPQGRLIVAVDNPRDRWLGGEMEKLFSRVVRITRAEGTVYQGVRRGPLKKWKDFRCEFACRDGQRLLRIISRPGVFSHRRVDPGARHLLNYMELHEGDRVLDLGCGSGVVTLGAAASSPQVHVHALDTNARAVECTRQGAEANDLRNISVELTSADDLEMSEPCQLVLANPPYFSGTRIVRAFFDAARRCLAPGGRILLVTKLPRWYAEHMGEWFEDVRAEEVKTYYLFRGTQPEEA